MKRKRRVPTALDTVNGHVARPVPTSYTTQDRRIPAKWDGGSVSPPEAGGISLAPGASPGNTGESRQSPPQAGAIVMRNGYAARRGRAPT